MSKKLTTWLAVAVVAAVLLYFLSRQAVQASSASGSSTPSWIAAPGSVQTSGYALPATVQPTTTVQPSIGDPFPLAPISDPTVHQLSDQTYGDYGAPKSNILVGSTNFEVTGEDTLTAPAGVL